MVFQLSCPSTVSRSTFLMEFLRSCAREGYARFYDESISSLQDLFSPFLSSWGIESSSDVPTAVQRSTLDRLDAFATFSTTFLSAEGRVALGLTRSKGKVSLFPSSYTTPSGLDGKPRFAAVVSVHALYALLVASELLRVDSDMGRDVWDSVAHGSKSVLAQSDLDFFVFTAFSEGLGSFSGGNGKHILSEYVYHYLVRLQPDVVFSDGVSTIPDNLPMIDPLKKVTSRMKRLSEQSWFTQVGCPVVEIDESASDRDLASIYTSLSLVSDWLPPAHLFQNLRVRIRKFGHRGSTGGEYFYPSNELVLGAGSLGTVVHELGHMLDYNLAPDGQWLSAEPEFVALHAEWVSSLPSDVVSDTYFTRPRELFARLYDFLVWSRTPEHLRSHLTCVSTPVFSGATAEDMTGLEPLLDRFEAFLRSHVSLGVSTTVDTPPLLSLRFQQSSFIPGDDHVSLTNVSLVSGRTGGDGVVHSLLYPSPGLVESVKTADPSIKWFIHVGLVIPAADCDEAYRGLAEFLEPGVSADELLTHLNTISLVVNATSVSASAFAVDGSVVSGVDLLGLVVPYLDEMLNS